MVMVKRKYTVVVAYPTRLSECADILMSYVALVEAENAILAAKSGRVQAMSAQENEHRGTINDWHSLAVFEGHIRPVLQS